MTKQQFLRRRVVNKRMELIRSGLGTYEERVSYYMLTLKLRVCEVNDSIIWLILHNRLLDKRYMNRNLEQIRYNLVLYTPNNMPKYFVNMEKLDYILKYCLKHNIVPKSIIEHSANPKEGYYIKELRC